MASISTAEHAPSNVSSPFLPIVDYALKSDVSPPLQNIVPVPPPVAGAVEQREMPLRPLLKANQTRRGQLERRGDAALQNALMGGHMPVALQNFDGLSNADNQAALGLTLAPPDTNGDVGPDHYIQIVNLVFAVYSKTGALLYGPAANKTLWSGFGGICESSNGGDPIALYDHLADRWLISHFAKGADFHQCIALSQTGDPTGAWRRYDFLYSATKFNDYPKFGVWPDGYYMTANQFDGLTDAWAGAGVVAFERAKMLAGLPARKVYFDLYTVDANFGGMLPADLDGPPPPPGAPNYLVEVDGSEFLPPTDALRLWEFHVNWANPLSSTLGLSGNPNAVLAVVNFDYLPCAFQSLPQGRDCIPQPGVSSSAYLDAVGDRLMYRLLYRNFGHYQALVVNHTVEADPGRAGIRWYELRDAGGGWTIYQQGTYAPGAEQRWMGSIALDAAGDIALGYSVSSSVVTPSIRYSGRLTTDLPGVLPWGEATLMAGSGVQTDPSSRWGDYSLMTVDPLDDCTFWYTTEYYAITSSSGWRTRIGAFTFNSDFPGACVAAPTGSLTGTVTDTDSSLPIADVRVEAGAYTAFTDAAGVYALARLPAGSYTVTASAAGYTPQTISGLWVNANAAALQDFALTAAPPVTVEGVVTDGSGHGWPLYARLDIASADGLSQTMFTHPLTGRYRVFLTPETPYTFIVTAASGGYTAQSRAIFPLAGVSSAEDFTLIIDSSCSAPGYTALLAEEGFEGGAFPPPGWSAYETGDVNGSGWQQGTSGTPGSNGGARGGAYYAWHNNQDLASSAVDWLVTPPIAASSSYTVSSLQVSFWERDHFTPALYGYHGLWVAAGADPDPLVSIYTEAQETGVAGTSWKQTRVDLSALARQDFYLAFRYEGDFNDEWYIDDVLICAVKAGGLVVGNVYDASTLAAVNGAEVTGQAAADVTTTLATPADPNVDDGFYLLFSSAIGLHNFRASMIGIGSAGQAISVANNAVAAQDFYLGYYGLLLTSTRSMATGHAGATVTYTLTLTNTGTVTDTFNASLSRNLFATTVWPVVGPIGSGAGAPLTVTVQIPEDASAGATDVAQIAVTSQGDNAKSAFVLLTTQALHKIYLPVVAR